LFLTLSIEVVISLLFALLLLSLLFCFRFFIAFPKLLIFGFFFSSCLRSVALARDRVSQQRNKNGSFFISFPSTIHSIHLVPSEHGCVFCACVHACFSRASFFFCFRAVIRFSATPFFLQFLPSFAHCQTKSPSASASHSQSKSFCPRHPSLIPSFLSLPKRLPKMRMRIRGGVDTALSKLFSPVDLFVKSIVANLVTM